ncbi:MAG: hypothetical protein R2695_18060 [Acidimicrobiales bacterium]
MLNGMLWSCVIGGAGGLVIAIVRRRSSRQVIADPEAVDGQPDRLLSHSVPFGPALALGTVIVVLFAESFV